jgi:nitrite reductase/ring-hydroxylating ferredoxin subunit
LSTLEVPGALQLEAGEVVAMRIPPGADGVPREVLVLRDPDSGELRAYVNRCKHLPIPIDGGSRQFLADDKRHLVCLTHGARYRVGDGYCVAGPCSGESLERLELEVSDRHVHVVIA